MKVKNSFYILSFISTIILLLHGCYAKKMSNHNLSGIYRKEGVEVKPDYCVYHIDEHTSQLYFRIDSKELLYMKQLSGDFGCNVVVHYNLKPGVESKEIIDSSSVAVLDVGPEDQEAKNIIGNLKVNAKSGAAYILEVILTDKNRNQEFISYIMLDKSNTNHYQNFFVTDENPLIPHFKNYANTKQQLQIKYEKNGANKLFVRYYNRNFPVAPPPFSVVGPKPLEYACDSLFTLNLTDSFTTTVTIPDKGFYHILADTNQKQGLTIFNYYSNFPEVSSAEQMIYPLIYITSKQEYEALLYSPNKKLAVEEFWLKIGGSKERARELIRKYYGRVADANKFFTSYLEGWKTDRGMVYIIYGPANSVYKTSSSENWTYGEENNLMSLTYTFVKTANPFTNNDYTIDRSSIYKDRWYRAVDVWRQGRIYLDN